MRYLLGLILFLFFSCAEEAETAAPVNLIPTEKMISLIVDLQVLESHYQRTFQRPDLYRRSLDSSSYFIFKDHEVTKRQFDSSYQYYALQTQVLYSMYEAALDSLNFTILE